MYGKFSRLILCSLLLVSVLVAGCSSAEKNVAYPTKQVEYIVPFSPGGASDLISRAVAEYLSKDWGQPVIVVNKPGGNGIIGAQAALKQGKPDGYTALSITVSGTTFLNASMSNPPIKFEDHIYVSQFARDSYVFVVKNDAQWKNMQEFTEWVKKNPDQLTWTSTGPSGVASFAIGEWLNSIGVDYKKTRMIAITGGADNVAKIAGGHAVLGALTIGESSTMLNAGKIRALGILAPQRSQFFPDVPTFEEQGFKGLTAKWWAGVSLPVGTPMNVVKRWETSIAKMTKDPAFIEKVKNIKMEAAFMNSSDFTNLIKNETAHFTDIATKAGIRK